MHPGLGGRKAGPEHDTHRALLLGGVQPFCILDLRKAILGRLEQQALGAEIRPCVGVMQGGDWTPHALIYIGGGHPHAWGNEGLHRVSSLCIQLQGCDKSKLQTKQT